MPPLQLYPKSQRVTFKYYEGVLFFLEENYVEVRSIRAGCPLRHADHANRLKNISLKRGSCASKERGKIQSTYRLTELVLDFTDEHRRILIYLIPCRLLTSHVLPTKKLLEPYPRLQELFLPLTKCIRQGDLRSFDLALQRGEEEFVKRRIYLTLERGRDIALRNLLRKVFIAGGFQESKADGATPIRRTRVPIDEFRVAITMGSGTELIDTDEVECLLANMIFKVRLSKPTSCTSQSFCFLWCQGWQQPTYGVRIARITHLCLGHQGRNITRINFSESLAPHRMSH